MWARFNIQTSCRDFNNTDIIEMVRNPGNEHARIEFVLRYFKSRWFSPFAEDEAKKICDEELLKLPQHNFFNYARAQLEKDAAKKKNYLMAAAKSSLPSGPMLSAQAAYEAAVSLYPPDEKGFAHCLAWLSKAIILGSEEARDCFINNNVCGKHKKFDLTMMFFVFLTTHLAGKRIAGLIQSQLLSDFVNNDKKDGLPRDASLITQAYHYPNHASILHQPDSPVRRIAEWVVMFRPGGFLNYFNYCFQNEIITEEIFRSLIQFYFNSNYTDKDDLRQYAVNFLNKHHLSHLFTGVAIPQTSTTYFMPLDQLTHQSAPLIDPYSSYHYLYTQTPQMAPMLVPAPMTSAPLQPTLTPTYQPVPPTPYNSPVGSITHEHDQDAARQPTMH